MNETTPLVSKHDPSNPTNDTAVAATANGHEGTEDDDDDDDDEDEDDEADEDDDNDDIVSIVYESIVEATLTWANVDGDDDEEVLACVVEAIEAKGDPQSESTLRDVVREELSQMIELSIPVIGTYLFEMLPGIVSVVLVGHIDSPFTQEYIDATALGVMVFTLVGVCPGMGLASAMDTLCSQAFGADEPLKMGVYLQTGMIVLSLTVVVVIIIMSYTREILLALGQPYVVSEMAGQFAIYMIPGLPFLLAYDVLRKIFQAQNDAFPMFVVALAANLIHIVFGYYLVFHTSWGWLGAAVARTICNMSFLILFKLYILQAGFLSTFWPGWKITDAWEGCFEFLSLGIPGMLQLGSEWGAYEMLAILSGLLRRDRIVAIASTSIILNISSAVYMVYYGLCTAGAVRLGIALGAGTPDRAKFVANLTVLLSLFASLFCAATLLQLRTFLPTLFTHDKAVDESTSNLLYVAAAFQVADAINAAIQGIFRGSGRQGLSAMLSCTAYYVIGLPLGALLAFVFDYGVMGLWIGISVGLMVVAIAGFLYVIESDWTALAEEAIERVE